MNAGNRSDAAWKAELSRTAECIPIERLDEDLTPSERNHIAHCARCQAEMALWTQMQQKAKTPQEAEAVQAVSMEVRRRLGSLPPNVVPAEPRRPIRTILRPAMLAAAAVVVVAISLGVFFERREPSVEGPVTNVTSYRSAGIEVIAPVGDLAAPPSTLQWKTVAGATTYEVDVLEVDQTPLWHASARETRIGVPASVVTKCVPGKSILWQVRARRGEAVIAESGIQRFRVSVAH